MIICYFGDSLTLGYGDEAGLGWPGRLSNTLREKGQELTSYNLGVRKDTSIQLQHRWKMEAMLRRLPDQDFKMVFSFGVADVANGVSTEETISAGVSILTQAKTMGDVLVVGPTPVNDSDTRENVTTLSRLLAGLCKRIDIPFVPTIDAMHRSFVYGTALNDGDGVHPAASGYAELAEYVLKFNTAREFFGLE